MKCAVIKKFGKEIQNLVIEKRDDPEATGENVRIKIAATARSSALTPA